MSQKFLTTILMKKILMKKVLTKKTLMDKVPLKKIKRLIEHRKYYSGICKNKNRQYIFF